MVFRRLTNVFRGFFARFVGNIERRHPEALLELEKEHLREQIARYNQGLAAHAGLAERLMSDVKRREREETQLRAKTSAHLHAGNQDAAGQYALQHQEVRTRLQEARQQLEEAERAYRELVRARDVAIEAAKTKIGTLKREIDELKIQRATAELSEMASGMISEIGGAGDTLNRLEEMVREERDRAAGRSRVARDSLSVADVAVQEAETKALARLALADFAAEMGIAMTQRAPTAESETPALETSKSMGRAVESA
jgi:phage shock protein A